ncbi:hypothetical protein TUM3792_05920 [Shewanella sp. MBTL60-007]|nr:hypothetical protein TUM3792_05920 [Shewanella sp. MBTL60-007]
MTKVSAPIKPKPKAAHVLNLPRCLLVSTTRSAVMSGTDVYKALVANAVVCVRALNMAVKYNNEGRQTKV